MQELDKILEFAIANSKNTEEKDYLHQRLTDKSLYEGRFENAYIQKVDYDIPISLQNKLRELWGEDNGMDILEKIIVVAAFKLRDSSDVVQEEIKEKVYNF